MKIKITKKEIVSEFDYIKNSSCKEIPGVYKIDSNIPGPTLGITVCTHGNELSGVAAIYYLRNIYKIDKRLKKGKILFVINNIRAGEKALMVKTKIERLKARYMDLNMNRLPKNLEKIRKDNRYEIKRSKELIPVWDSFDCSLDIHSTTQDNKPMIIAAENLDFSLTRGFPIGIVIKNIDKIQIGAPAFAFYGKGRNIQTLEIEAGQHESVKAQSVAVSCILSLLKNLKMINGKTKNGTREVEEYFIFDSVIFPHNKYELSKTFKDFELVKKGQLLASFKGKEIFSLSDAHVLFSPKKKKSVKINEEIMFLSKPVRKIIIK